MTYEELKEYVVKLEGFRDEWRSIAEERREIIAELQQLNRDALDALGKAEEKIKRLQVGLE